MSLLPLAGSLLVGELTAASPPIYRWTDATGAVHYTNVPSATPPEAALTQTTGSDISVVPGPPPKSPEEVARKVREARPVAEALALERQRGAQEADRARTAQLVEAARSALRSRVESLQHRLEKDRSLLFEQGKPVISRMVWVQLGTRRELVPDPAFDRARERTPRLEAEFKDARAQMGALENIAP